MAAFYFVYCCTTCLTADNVSPILDLHLQASCALESRCAGPHCPIAVSFSLFTRTGHRRSGYKMYSPIIRHVEVLSCQQKRGLQARTGSMDGVNSSQHVLYCTAAAERHSLQIKHALLAHNEHTQTFAWAVHIHIHTPSLGTAAWLPPCPNAA